MESPFLHCGVQSTKSVADKVQEDLPAHAQVPKHTHLDDFTMTASVPVRVGDFDLLILDILLLLQPFLPEFFPHPSFRLFSFPIRQERGVHVGIFEAAFGACIVRAVALFLLLDRRRRIVALFFIIHRKGKL